MTITINIPNDAESRLQQEAARAGVPIPTLIEDIVVERFGGHDVEAVDLKSQLDALAVSDVSIPHDRQGRDFIYD